ncbi:MAG: hypothetical protein JXB34_06595 [Bacteroidales bacterium]|nr:hypothetical protein [Bacteroidales bacterium]
MRNLLVLLMFTSTFIFSSCINTLKLSEIINIKTTKDSIDIDYQNVSAKVMKIDQHKVIEKIYAKYPDINKDYVDRIAIQSVKETKSLRKHINNVETNIEKNGIYVEITLNYEKSKQDQARLIIEYSKALIIDELIKLDIKIEKE